MEKRKIHEESEGGRGCTPRLLLVEEAVRAGVNASPKAQNRALLGEKICLILYMLICSVCRPQTEMSNSWRARLTLRIKPGWAAEWSLPFIRGEWRHGMNELVQERGVG